MASNFSFGLVAFSEVNGFFSITSPNNCSFSSLSYYFRLVRPHFESKALLYFLKTVIAKCAILPEKSLPSVLYYLKTVIAKCVILPKVIAKYVIIPEVIAKCVMLPKNSHSPFKCYTSLSHSQVCCTS